jgi:hypothetical protein
MSLTSKDWSSICNMRAHSRGGHHSQPRRGQHRGRAGAWSIHAWRFGWRLPLIGWRVNSYGEFVTRNPRRGVQVCCVAILPHSTTRAFQPRWRIPDIQCAPGCSSWQEFTALAAATKMDPSGR